MDLERMRVAYGWGLAILLLGGCATVHSSGVAFTAEDEALESEVRFATAVRSAFAMVRQLARDRRLTEFDCSRPGLVCTGYMREDLVVHAFVAPGPPRRMTVVITQTAPIMQAPVLDFHEELMARVQASVVRVKVERY